MIRIGKCCCGQSEIEVIGNPELHAVCNCNNCKQRSGSAFGISSYFFQDKFRITKDCTKVYELENEQGKQERYFCSNCGSTLFWRSDVFSGLVGVAGGCYTENSLPAPNFNSMTENQCSWVSFTDSVNRPITQQDIPKA